ncbi:hypothetical protein QQP08_027751 [Theobroma cacao]|nr:hypothetical protein QQP08_025194 [Theobroma cacao]WRX35264.1 hypothetical protein QQP08_027751 [Theobroma cacao]
MQEPPQNSNLETCSVPDSESCNTSSKFRFSSSFDTRRSVSKCHMAKANHNSFHRLSSSTALKAYLMPEGKPCLCGNPV